MPFNEKITLTFKVRRPHLLDIDSYLFNDDDFTITSNDDRMGESPEFDESSREAIKNSQISQGRKAPSDE
ncbi:hypothetical protein [Comamonas sp.]|uniref:hypothetical protein n=1 Tax=Comamonas sp. TaxID=34028 RepID=UPI003A952499